MTYKSSDESVATVDANGLVTGVADGESTIHVSVAASQYYQEGTKEVKVAVKRPLTFEALEDGQIKVTYNYGVSLEKPIVYTIDGKEKKEITATTSIPVTKGQKVEFESTNDHTSDYGPYTYSWGTEYTNRYVNIQPQSKCAVYGNVMSMITPDGNYHTNKTITKDYALQYLLRGTYKQTGTDYDYKTVSHDKYKLLLPATTLTNSCYYFLFYNTGITEVPELPATELATDCYNSMFRGCTSLTTAPALPATELAPGCYMSMFQGCTGLTAAPALPNTTLAGSCYYQMFYGCTGLIAAPELPAESLPRNCYYQMFFNCSKLNKVTCLAKEMTDNYAICQWLYGAGTDESVTERTFVHNKDNTSWVNTSSSAWSTDQWYVPTGWTIVDAE